MTLRLADLAPTDDELTRLRAALAHVACGELPDDWQSTRLDALGMVGWDFLDLALELETRFDVHLDDQIAGEHTVADLLAAVRAALRPGQLPHG